MKLGMVFEGGANRTVFSCGVTRKLEEEGVIDSSVDFDKFLEENIMPDYYIGVSAGMAYGLSYLSGQKGRNLELMEKYMADKRYMGMRHLLNRKEHAYYNTKFVFEEVPNELLPLDYDALARFPGEIEAAVTNIHTGKAEYMEVPRGKEMKDLLIATCSLPILFQPVKIGRHYYLDGGLADSVPYEHAMEMGCEKLVVVLTRERGYVKTQEKAAGVMNRLYQRYPKIVENMKLRAERYNASMEKLMQLEKEEKVFVIAPESTYGVGRTETDTIKLRRLYDEGYRIATEQTDALRAYLNK